MEKVIKYGEEKFDNFRGNQRQSSIYIMLDLDRTATVKDKEGNVLEVQKNEIVKETEKAYQVKITLEKEEYENTFWLPKSKVTKFEDGLMFVPPWIMREKKGFDNLESIVTLVSNYELDDYEVEVEIK